jgi:hypothetical protein
MTSSINREALKQKILDRSNLLPLFVWSALGLGACGTFFGFLSFIGILYIGGKDVPSLVQLDGGKSVLVEPVASNYRTEEVIDSFVKESMTLLFTWNVVNKDSGSRRIVDKGVEVGEGKVPTRTWQASFAIANDFRETFLQEMAASFIPAGVLSGDAQSTLLIESLSTPTQVKPGVWEVDMVAFLVVFDGRSPQGRSTSFNKTIVVKAVEEALDPLPEETSPIQKAVYETRSKGLVIDEIYELGSR